MPAPFEFYDTNMGDTTPLTAADGPWFMYDQQFGEGNPDGLDVFGVQFRDEDHGHITVLFTAAQALAVIENLAAQLNNVDALRLERKFRAGDQTGESNADGSGHGHG